jgi:5-methylcytosine-specific restriction endonuclease McrBC regulatory subunit McrC
MIDLVEHATSTNVRLTPRQARAIRSVRYVSSDGDRAPVVDVRPGAADDLFELRSRGVCGTLTIDDIDIAIHPRMTTTLLGQLVGRLAGIRDIRMGKLEKGADLPAQIDSNFLDQVNLLIRSGLAASYTTSSDVGSAPRGAIDFGWFANPLSIELKYSYPEISRSIAENRQLVAALSKISAASRRSGRPSSRARQLLAAFAGIPADAQEYALQDSTRFANYRPALTLAGWILRDEGISVVGTESRITTQGLLYEPSRIFEAYVQHELVRHAASIGAWVDRNAREKSAFLDAASRWRVFPDAVVWRGGACLAVADAKYKPRASPPSRSDMYQALSYAQSLDTKSAIYVYASDAHTVETYDLGRSGDVQVTVIRLDTVCEDIEALDAILRVELERVLV